MTNVSVPTIKPISFGKGLTHLYGDSIRALCGRKTPTTGYGVGYSPEATPELVELALRLGATHHTYVCRQCAAAYVREYGAPQVAERQTTSA